MIHAIAPRLVRTLGGTLLASALLASAGLARAEQFVLVDYTIDYTKAMADKDASHFYVRNATGLNPARPTDWTGPVNYRNGTVHIRTEVLGKPAGSETTQWTLCYMPNRPVGPGYGCTGSGTYKEQGQVVTRQESMTSWWQNTGINWTAGIKEMHFVIKDADGASGHAHKRADAAKFFPTKVRITMVQVSQGAQFDASQVPGWTTGGGAGDGGASDGASGGVSDAGAAVDSSGAGGASGSGGASGGGGGTPAGTGGSPAGTGGAPVGTGGSSTGTPAGTGGSSGTARGGSSGTATPSPSGSEVSGVGCSVGSGAAGTLPAWGTIPLLALALGLLRRRRRRG